MSLTGNTAPPSKPMSFPSQLTLLFALQSFQSSSHSKIKLSYPTFSCPSPLTCNVVFNLTKKIFKKEENVFAEHNSQPISQSPHIQNINVSTFHLASSQGQTAENLLHQAVLVLWDSPPHLLRSLPPSSLLIGSSSTPPTLINKTLHPQY